MAVKWVYRVHVDGGGDYGFWCTKLQNQDGGYGTTLARVCVPSLGNNTESDSREINFIGRERRLMSVTGMVAAFV